MFKLIGRTLTTAAFILICSPALTFAAHQKLNSYADILTALKQGDDIKAVVALNQCNPSSKKYQTTDELLWSVNFNNFYKAKFSNHGQPQEAIAVSVNKLRESEYGLVYEFSRVRVFKDGSLEGYNEMINPKTFTSMMKTNFHCNLADKAVKFYDLS